MTGKFSHRQIEQEIGRRIHEIEKLAESDPYDARLMQNELFEYGIELIASGEIKDAERLATLIMRVWDIDFYDCGCTRKWSLEDLGAFDDQTPRGIVKGYKWFSVHKLKKKNPKASTDQFLVINKNDDLLGMIYWRSGFRQYVFSTHEEYPVDLSRGCMRDICNFIDDLMEQRKK